MSFTSTKKFPSCFKFHPACHWLCQIQYLNLCVHYSGGNTNTDWEPRRQANLSVWVWDGGRGRDQGLCRKQGYHVSEPCRESLSSTEIIETFYAKKWHEQEEKYGNRREWGAGSKSFPPLHFPCTITFNPHHMPWSGCAPHPYYTFSKRKGTQSLYVWWSKLLVKWPTAGKEQKLRDELRGRCAAFVSI